jgi:hypothetical protein
MIHRGHPTHGERGTIMSTETTATNVDEVTAALTEQKLKIIDAAVREARSNSWCSEFERVLQRIFPEGSDQPRGEWFDSDGWTCRGYDLEGFDRNGWTQDGYNRDGYTRDGYDRDGYNADNVNVHGFTRDGLHVATGLHRDSDEFKARFIFDSRGYDFDGFNRDGRNRDGYTRQEWRDIRQNQCQYDADGYNWQGRDRYGYTREQNGEGPGARP